MPEVDWDARARQGTGWQSVIDPGDRDGLKNGLIDRIQWNAIEPWLAGRQRLLDYGCGIGRFARRVMEKGVAYTGVDASAAMIEAAVQSHADVHARTPAGQPASQPGGQPMSPPVPQFLHAPELPLPLADASFDAVLSVGVLQCLQTSEGSHLRAAVADLARVLEPGGELLMIEQASTSGRHSGSVSAPTSEQDYLDALAPHFEVVSTRRVRLGSLSRYAGLYIRHGKWLPARALTQALVARHETARATRAYGAQLSVQVYFDVAIQAVRRPAAA
ncbi:MAG: class I SAM-dependent methyltransferase [Rubrivivax sp.]